ncbi:mitotic checkpoint protein BUB3.3-like [Momordica charantia]|uniref:Mitotic checkpoint protein BUB3.3-like n=1 Tax=Momordica charantia TaxID=3673 RepID=A0A6J1DNJ9_MOMCH|nr:mitotic checkpoint protein BUB3.3-like [Momordica charantia]
MDQARSSGMEMNRVLLDFQDAISTIQFAPHSNNLLASSWDSSLRLYDVDSSAPRLEAPSEAALLDCCFQDESVAFSAGSDGFIRRYDLQSGILDTIGKHDDIATHIGYSGRTCQIVSAGLDRKILLWDTPTVKALSIVRNMGSDVVSMFISGFNLIVASGVCLSSLLRRYIFWCHPKSKARRNHLESVNAIAFNPIHHGAFATGDNEGFVSIWDFHSKRRLLELPRFPNSVASLSYNCGGELLAVASSCTFQEAREREDPPQLFLYVMEHNNIQNVASQ